MEQTFNILIVGRQPREGEVMKRILNNLGGGEGRIVATTDWNEAMALNSGRGWDVIVADTAVVADGQVSDWKTLLGQVKRVPVIVVGDAMDSGAMLEALDDGADSCIFRAEAATFALLSTVHATVDRRRASHAVSPLMEALAG